MALSFITYYHLAVMIVAGMVRRRQKRKFDSVRLYEMNNSFTSIRSVRGKGKQKQRRKLENEIAKSKPCTK